MIPGLPETERVRALNPKDKPKDKPKDNPKDKPKDKKEKKAKLDKKGSKEEEIDIKNLSQKDFLIKPKPIAPIVDDVSERFVFPDPGDEDEEFEDSREEIEVDTAFSTPITLKSAFARNVARSESKSRSRSTSVKRQFAASDAEDENKKRAKSLKSGIPAPRNSLKK